MKFLSVSLFTLCLLLGAAAASPGQEPTGRIRWARNLDAAMVTSKKDRRPVITYFTFDG
jgi:hypothetical protein